MEVSTDILFAGADAFSRQLIQLMNEKLIAPYSMITEKEKEIERLNREIGRLEALLEVSKNECPAGRCCKMCRCRVVFGFKQIKY